MNEKSIMIKGSEEMLPRVAEVEVHPEYRLLITFRNGERKIFDAKTIMQRPEYSKLEQIFDSARVQYGTVVWNGDIDISPDTLYLNSIPF